jgi:hypothetical protein
MIRNGLGTLLVVGILLGACDGDDGKLRDDDGGGPRDAATGDVDAGLNGLDGSLGSMDATLGGDATMSVRLPDGAIIQVPVASDAGLKVVVSDAGQVLCNGVVCQCADGKDQDGDGLIDQADPECVGPNDNDESTFATGIPGDNRDTACQDCFFDGNSGSGNDGCRVATSCLTKAGDSSSGRGSCDTCAATDKCRTSCQAYTPNGCDCFGCCTVNLGSNITMSVLLGGGCDINGVMLSAACVQCVPSTTCGNTCGTCELCPGKTLADLPASCTPPRPDGGTADASVPGNDGGTIIGGSDAATPPPPPPPVPTCDMGETVCGSNPAACGAGQVCAFGCCILTPLI